MSENLRDSSGIFHDKKDKKEKKFSLFVHFQSLHYLFFILLLHYFSITKSPAAASRLFSTTLFTLLQSQ